MMRPDKILHNMMLAEVTSQRATCCRRRVGAVLVNERFQIISTGYNGPPSGMSHCIDTPCSGADLPSGTGLDKCQAVHAEQNALLQCPNVYNIFAVFCTTAPCMHCVKLLMNTSCQKIYFRQDYPHAEEAKKLWLENDGEWIKVP